ncbi:MAG: SDR family oxidoreductase [Alphaproteobacteria bacterium]|nr:SDR family oxidoreductase [Alphaproteobacteria bacterium]
MDFGLNGKTAFVTGGSRGIGKATAMALAERGVDVAICGRTRETLDEAVAEIEALGVRAWAYEADVSRLEDIQRFVSDAAATAGTGADILINNAVTSIPAPFDEQTDEDWQYHINVKLMAYIRCAREVLPFMREKKWGRIVNIGGMTARISAPLRVTNGIVNAGVSNFTKSLSGQVGPQNITVNCVHPGFTATERMMANFDRRARDAGVSRDDIAAETIVAIPMGRLIESRDLANAALFFCSPLADIVTGQSIAVDGGSGESVPY